MKIGIHLGCCIEKISIDEQIRLMKENGFTTTFGMASGDHIDEWIEKCQAAGIEVENMHAPFRKINAMWHNDGGEEALKECEAEIYGAVDICARHGIPTLVMHVTYGNPPAIVSDYGFSNYDRFMEYARSKNVKIAYENTKGIGKLITAIERYEDSGFCWDVGHEHSMTYGLTYMPFLKDKMIALHVHDNTGKIGEDKHMIPFDGGGVDFEHVAKMLAMSGYDKSIMLESIQKTSGAYDDLTAEEFYKRAGDAAKKLATMVEKYKAEMEA